LRKSPIKAGIPRLFFKRLLATHLDEIEPEIPESSYRTFTKAYEEYEIGTPEKGEVLLESVIYDLNR
jgi:hypothetical protein